MFLSIPGCFILYILKLVYGAGCNGLGATYRRVSFEQHCIALYNVFEYIIHGSPKAQKCYLFSRTSGEMPASVPYGKRSARKMMPYPVSELFLFVCYNEGQAALPLLLSL
jgi:hypothetical protein